MYQPLISVIIPAYNAEKYIQDTVKSALSQTYKNFEIIIVNDGSTDATFQLIKNLANDEPQIRVFSIENSGLPAVARNYGIKHAQGELLAFLDADDLWFPTKLNTQLKCLIDNDADMVYSTALRFGGGFFSGDYGLMPLTFRAKTKFSELVEGNTICCSSVLVSKSIVKHFGGFDESKDLKAIEDYDLWLKISRNFKITFEKSLQVKYRIYEDGISRDIEGLRNRFQKMFILRGYKSKFKHLPKRNKVVVLVINSVHLVNIVLLRAMHFFK